ncbi:hypothetical protein I4U23_031438 [Adineta vaga]|nr:hypothetical protein I4U23_031438 [Adineta vaga]
MLRSFKHKNIVGYIDVLYENAPKDWQEQQEMKHGLRSQENTDASESTSRYSTDTREDKLDDVVVFVHDDNDMNEEVDDLSSTFGKSSNTSSDADEEQQKEPIESNVERKPVAYIIMELCKSETLKDRLVPEYLMNNGLERIEALRIFSQIVEGIIYLHEKRLIHRDLKPDNIFFSLDKADTVKIGDFGLVRREIVEESNANDNSTKITYSTGTESYMAPEQKLSDNRKLLTRKVDIYAMGIILFELLYQCLTGSERIKVLDNLRLNQPKFPTDVETKIGNEAKELILQSIHHRWDSRPTALQIRNQLSSLNSSDCKFSNLNYDIKSTRTTDRKVTTYVTTSIWKNVDGHLQEIIESHVDNVDDWKPKRMQNMNVVVLYAHRHEIVAFYNRSTMERFIIGAFSHKDHEHMHGRVLINIQHHIDIFRKQNPNLVDTDNVDIMKQTSSKWQIVFK